MKKEELVKMVESFDNDSKKIIIENFDEKTSFINDDRIVVIQDFSGPHPTKGWDVRIRASVIHLFVGGKKYRYEFPPYFEYDDFEGGETRRDPYEKALRVVSVKNLCVTVEVDGIGSEKKKINCKEVLSFVRNRDKGERENQHDRSQELEIRLKYEGDPRDLDFKRSPEKY